MSSYLSHLIEKLQSGDWAPLTPEMMATLFTVSKPFSGFTYTYASSLWHASAKNIISICVALRMLGRSGDKGQVPAI